MQIGSTLAVKLGTVNLGLGNVRYTVTPYVYWSKSGAMVIGYAVKADLALRGNPPTFWDTVREYERLSGNNDIGCKCP